MMTSKDINAIVTASIQSLKVCMFILREICSFFSHSQRKLQRLILDQIKSAIWLSYKL